MPFGEEIYADGSYRTTAGKYSLSGEDAVRKRFTGYEKDKETGLDFAEARYYNNQHGRFTAVDPLLASGKSANPQTFNRYVYCLNNPLIFTDPSGLQVGTGKWYFPKNGGAPEYLTKVPSADDYREATERNTNGDLIYIADGQASNTVTRLHPNGPGWMQPGGAGFLQLELMGKYAYFGWDSIRSDAFEATSIEHPSEGYERGPNW